MKEHNYFIKKAFQNQYESINHLYGELGQYVNGNDIVFDDSGTKPTQTNSLPIVKTKRPWLLRWLGKGGASRRLHRHTYSRSRRTQRVRQTRRRGAK